MELDLPTPLPRLAVWRSGSPWRAGRLPAAVDRRNTAARRGARAAVAQLARQWGPLALLTLHLPRGYPSNHATASRLAPALLRHLGLPPETYYAAHLGSWMHVHAVIPLSAAPLSCPTCGTVLRPVTRMTRQGEIVPGRACLHGCTHLRLVSDLSAAADYFSGPIDPRAHHDPADRLAAAEQRLEEGRHVMRGTLRRAPRWRGMPLARMLRRGRALYGRLWANTATPCRVALSAPTRTAPRPRTGVPSRARGPNRTGRPGSEGPSSPASRAILS
jgi:hypothetical protein